MKADLNDFQRAKAFANSYRPIKKGRHNRPLENFLNRICFGHSECWYWRGAQNRQGYGESGAPDHKAHRLAWRLFRGEIPAGMNVLHRCDKPYCVNPDHLFLGTQKDNVQDMIQKGRRHTTGPSGTENGQAKLTDEKVRAMRNERVKTGAPYRLLAMRYEVSTMTAMRVCTGETWKNV